MVLVFCWISWISDELPGPMAVFGIPDMPTYSHEPSLPIQSLNPPFFSCCDFPSEHISIFLTHILTAFAIRVVQISHESLWKRTSCAMNIYFFNNATYHSSSSSSNLCWIYPDVCNVYLRGIIRWNIELKLHFNPVSISVSINVCMMYVFMTDFTTT